MRIAICDDDERCLEEEHAMIAEAAEELGIAYETELFTDPAELIAGRVKYDVIFMDVEMRSMSGIEAAEAIHGYNRSALIFFVTNHEGYMDEALNKHAFRFWVKPINRQRLIYGMESAVREINSSNTYLQVTIGSRLARIPMNDIIYACAKNKMTSLVTTGGTVEIKEPFKNILARLNGGYFCRSHASYCVNLNYVVRYDKEKVVCRSGGTEYEAYMSKRCYGGFTRQFIRWAGDNV